MGREASKRILDYKEDRSLSNTQSYLPPSKRNPKNNVPPQILPSHSPAKTPLLHTPLTFKESSISTIGFPSTRSKSAFNPSLILPRSWKFMRRAVTLVAERRASSGVKWHFVTKRESSWWRERPHDVPRAGAAESEPLFALGFGGRGEEGVERGERERAVRTTRYQYRPPSIV